MGQIQTTGITLLTASTMSMVSGTSLMTHMSRKSTSPPLGCPNVLMFGVRTGIIFANICASHPAMLLGLGGCGGQEVGQPGRWVGSVARLDVERLQAWGVGG